uniref:Glycosyl transferase family 2 n=1 Tax=Marseillevirus LCMAC202 TaxID=2506606 RepID=A0A481YXP7_9VIRU|nr:MAG: glycosyl transferase family 2 [Marseillevirus LCMAC202]
MGKKKNCNAVAHKCRLRKGKYRKAKIVTHQNGAMDLVLPDIPEEELQQILPNVSIVTITKDRGAFAGILLYNWMNIKYPREKLEWVILDDSEHRTDYDLEDYLPPDDPYIKYVKLDRWCPVAEKRNKAVELASHEFIVHMDDDDYYFPDHVLAKIRILLQYNCQGVHSLPIGVYDMMERSSYIFDPTGKADIDTNDVAEATLAYRKDYWRNHKFVSDNPEGMGEGRGFIGKRFSKWVNLHFMFNMISITHSKNVTGHGRRFINENLDTVQTGRFEDVFPPAFNLNLDNIRKILAAEYVQPDIPAHYEKELRSF